MAYIFPIFRGAVNLQDICPYLECREPIHIYPSLDRRPCGRVLFCVFRCQKVKILGKIARCARQRGLQNHDFDYDKAKMKTPPK